MKNRNLKEGSPMEEEFLVEVLLDIVFTKEMLDKIEHLVEFLILFVWFLPCVKTGL